MKLEIYGTTSAGFKATGENIFEQLAQCPFCGSEQIEVGNTHTPSYRAHCLDCDAEGPLPKSPKRVATKTREAVRRQHQKAFAAAVEAWNKRAV